MNLITQMSGTSQQGTKTIPLSLTIRPACGVPGDYKCFIDSAALMRMLHRKTDLSFDILSRFEGQMCSGPSARLMGVELSESVLTEIGYFIE
jgi:hypothetical protein